MSIITPSYLQNDQTSFSDAVNRNHSLKVGQVIDVILPESGGTDESGSPLEPLPPFPLYTVLVSEKIGDTLVTIPFTNCILRDAFGSIPDFFEFSLRKSNYATNTSSTNNPGPTGSLSQAGTQTVPSAAGLLGSNVLIECINGSTFNAVILGAVRTYNPNYGYSPGYTPVDDKTGKYLQFNFNGLSAKINDDCEFTLQRFGPQNDDGTQQTQSLDGGDYNSDAAGSLIKIDKAGGINISAGTNEITSSTDKQNRKFTPNILLEKSGKVTITSGQGDDSQEQDSPNNSIVMNTDGSIVITMANGNNLQLQGHADDATLTLGSGSKSAAVSEPLQTMYNSFLQQLAEMTVSTAFGPSGTPLNIAAFPNWDDNINSKSTKIPK